VNLSSDALLNLEDRWRQALANPGVRGGHDQPLQDLALETPVDFVLTGGLPLTVLLVLERQTGVLRTLGERGWNLALGKGVSRAFPDERSDSRINHPILMAAGIIGDAGLLELLWGHLSQDNKDYWGICQNALNAAVVHNRLECVRFLKTKTTGPDAVKNWKLTDTIERSRTPAMVNLLLEGLSFSEGSTYLVGVATQTRPLFLYDTLFEEHGVDLWGQSDEEKKDNFCQTVLHEACVRLDHELISWIADKGGEMNSWHHYKTGGGWREEIAHHVVHPLQSTLWQGQQENPKTVKAVRAAMDLLLKLGADPLASNPLTGEAVLHTLIGRENGNAGLALELISNPHLAGTPSENGRNAIHALCEKATEADVLPLLQKAILGQGAPAFFNLKDPDGITPFLLLARRIHALGKTGRNEKRLAALVDAAHFFLQQATPDLSLRLENLKEEEAENAKAGSTDKTDPKSRKKSTSKSVFDLIGWQVREGKPSGKWSNTDLMRSLFQAVKARAEKQGMEKKFGDVSEPEEPPATGSGRRRL
jgi:ankyrin repeat protein